MEADDNVLVIKRIHVTYHLRLDADEEVVADAEFDALHP